MISAGGDFLKGLGAFGAILIDEVAQCTEIGAIVPIVQRGCHRLVLAGDHCQLPPSVCACVHVCECMCVCMYWYMCVCVCIYIFIHVYI